MVHIFAKSTNWYFECRMNSIPLIFIAATLVHEIFAWVFSRSAPARIYNPRELEWSSQLKVRKNKIVRFLKDVFWFFFLSLTKYQQNTNILDVLVWQNQTFFCRCAKIRFARKWKKWGCAKIECAKIKLIRKFHELRYDSFGKYICLLLSAVLI